jgi:hypothetical protein
MKRIVGLAIIFLVAVVVIAGLLILPQPLGQSTAPGTATQKIPSNAMGICVHSLSVQDASIINATGARWIRIDISNNETDLTNSLANAKCFNLSVLGILGSWMFFDHSCNITLAEWSNAVSCNVSKYAPYVDAWEIWNEPTSPELGWKLQADYFSMVQAASPIIRQYDSSSKIVLLGGLQLYTGGSGEVQSDIEFARNLSSMNIAQYGDAISVHAYPWNKPDAAWNTNFQDSLSSYRALFPGLEVWVTETGQNISDSGLPGQAQYLNQSLSFFKGKVDKVFWYALHDDNPGEGDFGLVNTDNSPRGAYGNLQDFFLG